jgi:superfamily II DNA/RNA helicase
LSAALRLPVDEQTTDPTFADLGVPAALAEPLARSGITTPRPIQALTLPDALAGRDVLGRAETGSGKTLAFGLPMLARLASVRERRRPRAPRALVLAPTRELAVQIRDALAPLASALGLKVMSVYGGSSIRTQITLLRRGVDVVVATPGRLTDLINQNECTLDKVTTTVLDEADHMADLGFLPAVTWLLDLIPAGGQRMLFSATLDGDVDVLVSRYLREPVRHDVVPATPSGARMDHRFQTVTQAGKVDAAAELIADHQRTLVFTRTRHGADRLARQLTRAGYRAEAMHGDLTQNARRRALEAFSSGRVGALVATDVAARGIHVDDIDLVVHYDPPAEAKAYLHRSGRTARAGAAGTVVTLVLPDQTAQVERLKRAAGLAPAGSRPSGTRGPRPGGPRQGRPGGGSGRGYARRRRSN